MHKENIITAGNDLKVSKKALIMIHGRGGNAEDILSLASHLEVQDYALLAPQATNNSWYPQSFLALPTANQPWLDSALALIAKTVSKAEENGIRKENIYFAGFSQGACLALEYVTRNASKFGGVAAFTGGLIGDRIYRENYSGDFEGTNIFIGTGNPDPHVPVERVYATANILKEMNAMVTEKIYENMGHTINTDEISNANKLIFNRKS